MSTVALTPALPGRPAINHWVVAFVVVVPTFMEILDTTIANVALRYISGGLSAAESDADWVITSYLAANAIVLPITGWLAAHLGRRNYFLLSIFFFTLASMACGMATSLEMMILFRIVQGLAGGGLQPCSQGILMDAFPPEKQGTAMTLFAVAAVLGPVVGPTLGGWLCVDYNWRWIFYVNIPMGVFALVAGYFLVHDPDYLVRERTELHKKPVNFDTIGLGLLSLVMACWETLLSKGQEWDWLADPFWRVQTLLILFVLGLGMLLWRELRIANPIIDFRCLRDRNLAIACVILFFAFAVVYGSSIALPGLLQTLFGYDALRSGLAMSPSGVTSMLAMITVGALLGRGVDARWLVAAGLAVMAVASYWMALMNLEISFWQAAMPRMLLTLGLGLMFAPISVAAYKYIPAHMRGAAVGIASLLRTEGGSVGTSMASTIEKRRLQLHVSRVNEFLDPLNSYATDFLEQSRLMYLRATGDASGALQMALQSLDDLRQQQAMLMAYLDVFWICAVVSASLLVLVLFMRRSAAEPGQHISAE